MPRNAKVTTDKQDDDHLHLYNSLLKNCMSEGHEYKCLRNKSTKSDFSESNEFQSFV